MSAKYENEWVKVALTILSDVPAYQWSIEAEAPSRSVKCFCVRFIFHQSCVCAICPTAVPGDGFMFAHSLLSNWRYVNITKLCRHQFDEHK